MTITNTANWTRPKLNRFKEEINNASENEDHVFHFEGDTFVLAYAKYLAIHLDSKLSRHSGGRV
jgi:hypothetical protein